MSTQLRARLGASIASVLFCAASAFAARSMPVVRDIQIGDLPEHTFRLPVINGPWISSLASLRGKPTLFEFWGTRCPSCIAGAVPASLKLQEAFGDDLQVVFVECQGATLPEAEALAIGKRWMGGRAFWTIEPPFLTGASMLPNFVLLGSDGRVLLKGNPFGQAREIERLIAEEIRKEREPPPEVHPAVRSAWIEFRAQQMTQALADVRLLAADTEATPEVRAAAATTLAVFQAIVERDLARASVLITHGLYDEAASELERLKRALRGDGEFEPRVAQVVDRLNAPELEAERESARTGQRLASRFYRSGGDGAVAAELAAFADRSSGTLAGKRAAHLAGLVGR